jgi:hypothetical protein
MTDLGSFVRKLEHLERVYSACYRSFIRADSLGESGVATAHGFEP